MQSAISNLIPSQWKPSIFHNDRYIQLTLRIFSSLIFIDGDVGCCAVAFVGGTSCKKKDEGSGAHCTKNQYEKKIDVGLLYAQSRNSANENSVQETAVYFFSHSILQRIERV